MDSSPPPFLTHQWVLAGVASAAARFVPVPFVDDMIRDRSRQFAVARTLAAHGVKYRSSQLAPLYDSGKGFFGGVAGKLTAIPLKLALYPVRKMVRIFGSVRGVPLDLMRTVLIGRTLDRCLRRGVFSSDGSSEDWTRQARRVRDAFEVAFDDIDWRAVKSLMGDTMVQVKHFKAQTVDKTRQVFGRDDVDPDRLDDSPLRNDAAVASGATKVETMLQKPEILELMADFDRRFDEAFEAGDREQTAG